MKTFKVTYTKKIGGKGTILVKSENEEQALKNACFLCATGSDFRNAIETEEVYSKPRKQGFFRKTLTNIENGSFAVKIDTIGKLANALGCKIEITEKII